MNLPLIIHPKLPVSTRKRVRKRLVKLHGDLCCWCRKPMYFGHERHRNDLATIEHIVPRRIGGSNDDMNLRLAHYLCNAARDQSWGRA